MMARTPSNRPRDGGMIIASPTMTMSTAGTAPPARTANVSKAGSVSVFLLTATSGFFEANLLLGHVAAFTVVRKPGGVSPRSKRTIVARAVNTKTGTTSNDAVGSATSTSQRSPDGSQDRPAEEKFEQEFTAAQESSELVNKRPSNREQQGARRGASSAFLATFAPSRTGPWRARGTRLTTLVNRAKSAREQHDDTEFLLHDDTTTAEEQLPVPTKKASHDTAAVGREGTTVESTRKLTDAVESGPSSSHVVEEAGLLSSSRHHELHSGSVTQASLVQREEAGQGLEVSVVSDTTICGDEEARHNKLLNGTVILDFDVWTPERNFGGDDTMHYTLVGAAAVPPEVNARPPNTLQGPNLVNAAQCAAVCAAWPKFSSRTGNKIKPEPLDALENHVPDVTCTGWTYYNKASGPTPVDPVDGSWYTNGRNWDFDGNGQFGDHAKESKGPACRLFSGEWTEIDFVGTTSHEDLAQGGYKFSNSDDIESGVPCSVLTDSADEKVFEDCKEGDFGLFLDWPSSAGGKSPHGGSMFGNAKVNQGLYQDASESIVYQDATTGQVSVTVTAITLQDAETGDFTTVKKVTGVPKTGEDWTWEYLPDGPGMGYFLCMAWCRITPWCKAMSAGRGNGTDLAEGCWLRDATMKPDENIYRTQWAPPHNAAVHSAYTVCAQIKSGTTDAVVIGDQDNQFVCQCSNGEKRNVATASTCLADGQQDCAECDHGYALRNLGTEDEPVSVCWPTCQGMTQCRATADSTGAYLVRTSDSSQVFCNENMSNDVAFGSTFPDDECESACCTTGCKPPADADFTSMQERTKNLPELLASNEEWAALLRSEDMKPENSLAVASSDRKTWQLTSGTELVECADGWTSSSDSSSTPKWYCPAAGAEVLMDGCDVPKCSRVAADCNVPGSSDAQETPFYIYQDSVSADTDCASVAGYDGEEIVQACQTACCVQGCKKPSDASGFFDKVTISFSAGNWKTWLSDSRMMPGKSAISMPVDIGSASCAGSGDAEFYCSQSGAELQVAGCADETATAPEHCECEHGNKKAAATTDTCYLNGQQDCAECTTAGFELAPIEHVAGAQQCLPEDTGTPTCRCDGGTMKAVLSTATCYQNGQQDCDFCTETDSVERPVPDAPDAKQCRPPPVCECDHGTKNPAGSQTCYEDGQQDCYECTEPGYNLSDEDVPGAPSARSCVRAAKVCECQHGTTNPADSATCHEDGQQDCALCTEPGYVLMDIRMDWKACLPTCEVLGGACSAPGYNVTGDSSQLCRAVGDLNVTNNLFSLPDVTDCEATCCTNATTETHIATGGHSKVEEVIFGGGGTNESTTNATEEAVEAGGGLAAPLAIGGGICAALLLILGIVLFLCCTAAEAAKVLAPASPEVEQADLELNTDPVFILSFGDAEAAFLSAGLSPMYAKKLAAQVSRPSVSNNEDLARPSLNKDLEVMTQLGLDFEGGFEQVGRMRGFLHNLAVQKYGEEGVKELLLTGEHLRFSFGHTEHALVAHGFTPVAAKKLATKLQEGLEGVQDTEPTDEQIMNFVNSLSKHDLEEMGLEGEDYELFSQLIHRGQKSDNEGDHVESVSVLWKGFARAGAINKRAQKQLSLDLAVHTMTLDLHVGEVERVETGLNFTSAMLPPKKKKNTPKLPVVDEDGGIVNEAAGEGKQAAGEEAPAPAEVMKSVAKLVPKKSLSKSLSNVNQSLAKQKSGLFPAEQQDKQQPSPPPPASCCPCLFGSGATAADADSAAPAKGEKAARGQPSKKSAVNQAARQEGSKNQASRASRAKSGSAPPGEDGQKVSRTSREGGRKSQGGGVEESAPAPEADTANEANE